jgi:hypothetical protein
VRNGRAQTVGRNSKGTQCISAGRTTQDIISFGRPIIARKEGWTARRHSRVCSKMPRRSTSDPPTANVAADTAKNRCNERWYVLQDSQRPSQCTLAAERRLAVSSSQPSVSAGLPIPTNFALSARVFTSTHSSLLKSVVAASHGTLLE